MCKVLKISRATYYRLKNKRNKIIDSVLENAIIRIFNESKKNYGTRKIKKELLKEEIIASRRKIKSIMDKYGLISRYTIKTFKAAKTAVNEDKISNVLNRNFKSKKLTEVVVSDLTYVNVCGKWNYVCILIDLFNREIIGYSAGDRKDSKLVQEAFMKSNRKLSDISIFHTDRGSEFKNKAIDNILNAFNIERSLSRKGNPYDNAVAEATFKVFKTEFINGNKFNSLQELNSKLFEYVNWYNNKRIHGSLGYVAPVEYRMLAFDKKVS